MESVGRGLNTAAARSVLLGENFVARELVSLVVVGGDAIWVAVRNKVAVMAAILVVKQVTQIRVGVVVNKTRLLIGNFLLDHWIIVVGVGIVQEALVKDGLKEEVEVAHETGMVTVLVLGEDGKQSVVDFLVLLVFLFL